MPFQVVAFNSSTSSVLCTTFLHGHGYPSRSSYCLFLAFNTLLPSLAQGRLCLLLQRWVRGWWVLWLPIFPSLQSFASKPSLPLSPNNGGRGCPPPSKSSPVSFSLIYLLSHPQEQDPHIVPSSILILLNLSAAFYSTWLMFLLLPWLLLWGSFGNLHFLPGKSQPHHPSAGDPRILISNPDFPKLRFVEDLPVSQTFIVSKELCMHWPQPITQTALPLWSLAQWRQQFPTPGTWAILYSLFFSLTHIFMQTPCLKNDTF